MYSWNHHGRSVAAATASIGVVDSVDSTMAVRWALAARAVASSPSGCAMRWKAVGATSTGHSCGTPRMVQARDRRDTSRNTRYRIASAAQAPGARRSSRSSLAPPA